MTLFEQTRHYIDIHLGIHVNDITQHLRQTAIVLYFQPFETIRLDRMASAFGWSVQEVEREVVALIQSDQIQARVDSQNKVTIHQLRVKPVYMNHPFLCRF